MPATDDRSWRRGEYLSPARPRGICRSHGVALWPDAGERGSIAWDHALYLRHRCPGSTAANTLARQADVMAVERGCGTHHRITRCSAMPG
jgi:hypothetical protein